MEQDTLCPVVNVPPAGVQVGATAVVTTPVPESVTVSGLVEALDGTKIVAVSSPTAVGKNLAMNVQFPAGAMVALEQRSEDTVNCGSDGVPRVPKIKSAVPIFSIVIV